MTAEVIEFYRQRKAAYQLKFKNLNLPDLVRDDLAEFCRAYRSCFDPDPREHARLEGRRQVWERIWLHLTFEPEELARIYGALRGPDDPDRDGENNPT